VDEKIYAEAVNAYRRGLVDGTHDSLVTVTLMQTYLWNDEGPVNYDRTVEKWPRTQTLPLWYEINSAIFLADVAVYREQEDRLGRSPRLFVLDGEVAMDIDREDDFALAQARWFHRG